MDELRSSCGSNSLNSSASSFSEPSGNSTNSSTKLSCSGTLTFTPAKLFADSDEKMLPNDSIKFGSAGDCLGSEVNQPIVYNIDHGDDFVDCDIKDDVVESEDDVVVSDNVNNDEDNSSDSDDVDDQQNSHDSDNVNNVDIGENSDDVNNDEDNSSDSDDVDIEQNSDDSDNINNVDNGENLDFSVDVNNDEDKATSDVTWQHDGEDLRCEFITALMEKVPPNKFLIPLRKNREFDNRLRKVAETVKEIKRELRQHAKSKGSTFLNEDDVDSTCAFNDNDFSLYHLMRNEDLAIKDVPIDKLIDIENQLKESKNTVRDILEEIQELYYVAGYSAQGKERDENEDSEEDTENSEDESEEELNSKTLDKDYTEDESVKELNSKTLNNEDSEDNEDSEGESEDSEDESRQELNSNTLDKEDTEDESEDSDDESVKELNSRTSNKEDGDESENSEDESREELNSKTSDRKDTEDPEDDESGDSEDESD